MGAEDMRERLVEAGEKLALARVTLERAQGREASPSELHGAEQVVAETIAELRRLSERLESV